MLLIDPNHARLSTDQIEEVNNIDDPDVRFYENGGLHPGPHTTLAGPTFEEWLGRELS